MSTRHLLHKEIGKKILDRFGSDALVDPACADGTHRLPLFCSGEKSRESEFCNVDALVMKRGEVKAVVEIEEADIKPTQVCGKILTSALSRFYIYRGTKCPLSQRMLFVQVVDTSKLKHGSRKEKQFDNLKAAIQGAFPLKNGRMVEYALFALDKGNEAKMQELLGQIAEFLKHN